MLESAVAYDGLPISSGGAHALGRVSARGALAAWSEFLATCTVSTPLKSWFDFPQTPELDVDQRVLRMVSEAFPPAPQPSSRHVVPADRINEAMSLLEDLEPQPTNPWGMAPVWLWVTTDFQLRVPGSTTEIWPGQDPALFGHFQTPGGVTLGASSTRLILQAKRSIGLSLSIPQATDEDLAELVPWLQAALPLRLSMKHWTRWTLTKNQSSYLGKKIAPAPPR